MPIIFGSLFQVCGPFLVICIFLWAVSGLGNALIKWSCPSSIPFDKDILLRRFGGYYLGIAAAVSLLVSLSTLGIPFRTSVWGVFLLGGVCDLKAFLEARGSRNFSFQKKELRRTLAILVVVCAFFSSSTLLIWGFDSDYSSSSSPHASFGSIESGRYANVANSIVSTQRIPVLGQNYLQSILAAIPSIVGYQTPVLNLFLLLVLNQTILFLFIYYSFRRIFQIKTLFSLFGAFLMFLGSWSLLNGHVMLIDSAFPIQFNGYTDTLMSLGSFICFLFVLRKLTFEVRDLLLIFVFSFSWAFFAPQNFIAAASSTAMLALYWLLRNKKGHKARLSLGALFICLLGFSLGSIRGGMVSPMRFRTTDKIPGLVTTDPTMKPHLRRPGLDYMVLESFSPGFVFHHISQLSLLEESKGIGNGLVFLSRIILALRLLFLPILGAALFGILLLRKKVSRDSVLCALGYSGLVCFAVGGVIAFFFTIGDQKWQLSRFLFPGAVINVLVFLVLVLRWLSNLKLKWVQASSMVVLSLFLIPAGGSLYYRWKIYGNFEIFKKLKRMESIKIDVGKF